MIGPDLFSPIKPILPISQSNRSIFRLEMKQTQKLFQTGLKQVTNNKPTALIIGGVATLTTGGLIYTNFFKASDEGAHVTSHPWNHNRFDEAFDSRR
jgi:hypothetical protein